MTFRRIVSLVLRSAVYCAVICAFAATVLPQSPEEIIRRERYFYDQLKAGNLKALPAIFDRDFTGVSAGGVLTKEDEVNGFPHAVLDDYRFSEIVVRFPSRDVGIIIYRAYIKGSYKGRDVTGESYHSSTYKKSGGDWKMVLHTEASVPSKQKELAMSEEFIGIATSLYVVPDLAKAKTWYSKAFDTKPYFDEPFYVGFNINGYELGLLPAEGERKTGNSSIAYWAVKDVRKSFAAFIEAGATEYEKPTDVGGGVITAAVKDPWDNIIGLIFNPEFKK